VKELAGHQSINTTMFYVKAANNELKDAVDNLANNSVIELESQTKVANEKQKSRQKAAK